MESRNPEQEDCAATATDLESMESRYRNGVSLTMVYAMEERALARHACAEFLPEDAYED